MSAAKNDFMEIREREMATVPQPFKKRNIFDITKEALSLQDMLEESGGELTPELEQALATIDQEFDTKAGNYGGLLLSLDSDVDSVDREIERLQAIKKSRKKAIERLKSALLNCMNVRRIKKLQLPTITLSVRESTSVEVLDEELLAPEYFVTKREVSKSLISAALKEGTQVNGAQFSKNQNLQIK